MNDQKTNPTLLSNSLVRRFQSWWRIVGVIVILELRQRLRTTRWKVTLAIVFAVLSVIVFGSLYFSLITLEETFRAWSLNLYSILMGMELFIGIILVPTLTATTINGDRKDATLALVQATPISHWQLATGKILGNWAASIALVLIASPYLIWAIIISPHGIAVGLLGILVLSLLFLCYSGIGLGFSALTARPAGSAVLTQSTVFFLLLGLPLIFGLLLQTTKQQHEVIRTRYNYSSPHHEMTCYNALVKENFYHTERLWLLLAVNPLLIVADTVGERGISSSIAVETARITSAARSGPYIANESCRTIQHSGYDVVWDEYQYDKERRHESSYLGKNWYIGLVINLFLGVTGYITAGRRLRVPADKLPRGVRIA